jgi:hypothetical protein
MDTGVVGDRLHRGRDVPVSREQSGRRLLNPSSRLGAAPPARP